MSGYSSCLTVNKDSYLKNGTYKCVIDNEFGSTEETMRAIEGNYAINIEFTDMV